MLLGRIKSSRKTTIGYKARIAKSKAIFLAVSGIALVTSAITVNGAAFFPSQPTEASSADNPFVLTLTLTNGAIKTVNVTNILPTDTPLQKAAKIASAVNKQVGNGYASYNGLLGAPFVSLFFAPSVTITDPTGEPSNKYNDPNKITINQVAAAGNATGLDPSGGASLVSVGIQGSFVGQIVPASGESAASVLNQMATDLTDNGIAATYDSNSGIMALTEPLGTNEYLVFGNTDPGLLLSVTSTEVPEPAALVLMGIAGAAPLLIRRRRGPLSRRNI